MIEGIQATVATLRGEHPGYSDIRGGLGSNAPDKVIKGLAAGSWGTNSGLVKQIYDQGNYQNEPLPNDHAEGKPGTPDPIQTAPEAQESTTAAVVAGPVSEIQSLIEGIAPNWGRLAQGLAGILLIGAGIVVITRTFTPQGAILKAIGG